jgi:hypothetical protein
VKKVIVVKEKRKRERKKERRKKRKKEPNQLSNREREKILKN